MASRKASGSRPGDVSSDSDSDSEGGFAEAGKTNHSDGEEEEVFLPGRRMDKKSIDYKTVRRKNKKGTTLLIGQYQLGDRIGKGAFGKVFKGLNIETGTFVAIKRLSRAKVDEQQMMSEINLLKTFQHDNIVKYFGLLRSEKSLNLILEYVEGGSLAQVLTRFGVFPEQLAGRYTTQILAGLTYLHQKGVIHRDIKGSNVLINKDGQIKLADFGIAIVSKFAAPSGDAPEQDQKQQWCAVEGSPFWMAPEVIEMQVPNTPKCDIWSLGCTIIELVTGFPPYFDSPAMTAVFKMVNEPHPPLPDDITPELEDLLMACFRRDPAARPSAQQLMEHRWLKKPKKEEDPNKKLELSELTKSVQQYNTLGREKAKRQLLAEVDWGGAEPPADLKQLAFDSPASSSPSRADSTNSDNPTPREPLRSSQDRPSSSPTPSPKKLSTKSTTKEKKSVSIKSTESPPEKSHQRTLSGSATAASSLARSPSEGAATLAPLATAVSSGTSQSTSARDAPSRPRRETGGSSTGGSRTEGVASAPPTLTEKESESAGRLSRDKLKDQLNDMLRADQRRPSAPVLASGPTSPLANSSASPPQTTHHRSTSAGPTLGAVISHDDASAVIIGHETRKNLLFSFIVFRLAVVLKGSNWTVYKTFSDFKDFHAKLQRSSMAKGSSIPEFPAKKLFGTTSPQMQAAALNRYLQHLLASSAGKSELVDTFLHTSTP